MFNKVAALILSNLPYGNVPVCCNGMVCVEHRTTGEWQMKARESRPQEALSLSLSAMCNTRGKSSDQAQSRGRHCVASRTPRRRHRDVVMTQQFKHPRCSSRPNRVQLSCAHTHMPTSMLHTGPPSGRVWFGQRVSSLERETSTCHFCLQTTDVRSCVMDPL